MFSTHTNTNFPRIPLKDMDGSLLWFELSREIDRVVEDEFNGREMIASAASLASFLHRNQTRMVRKNLPRTPYIEHPLRVALRLIRWGRNDAVTITAALLHDVIEDCAQELVETFMDRRQYPQLAESGTDRELALAWLAENYTESVAFIVNEVSNPEEPGFDYAGHQGQIEDVRSKLLKASDTVDNPGSLIHQFGHVPEGFIRPKVIKYSASVPVLMNSLTENVMNDGVPNALQALAGVWESLTVLRAELDIAD